jgi:hypothetical protein
MRHQYTPIFRDVLTSRIWAQPHATVRVWLWLQVAADPEGYVPATTSGVAVGARVTLEEARDALALLESPDPDAAMDDPLEGVVVERVPRGFRVLSFTVDRERAKHESHKARNRRYMQRVRAEAKAATASPPLPANDATVDANPGDVDAPKPIPIPKPILSEEDPPLPPSGPSFDISRFEGDRFGSVAFESPVLPTVLRTLPDDWRLSDELRAEAVTAGVPAADVDQRIADLRTGPIGGQRGVLAHKLEAYVRSQFGKWRTWAETDRARAASQKARPGALKGYGSGGAPLALEPTARHREFAARFGLDLGAIVADLNERGTVDSLGLGRAKELLEKALAKAARAKREGAAA